MSELWTEYKGGVWSATGHRPDKFGGYDPRTQALLVETAMRAIQWAEPEKVLTGMALGWDQAVATACYGLGVPFVACVPFEGQESRWRPEQQKIYREMLNQARTVVEVSAPPYSPEKMITRDKYMVDHSTRLMANWNGDDKGGTAKTVKYAWPRIPIFNWYPVFSWLRQGGGGPGMTTRSCLNCSFGSTFKCQAMMEMAARIVVRNVTYTDGLAFMEVKAAGCDAYNGTVPKQPKRPKGQLAFNFVK